MPRQKYSGHFSRATVFQHTSGEVFPPCRKLSRAGRSPVNRVICSLIKRVINSTGSRQALLKTDSRPRSFRMFRALATIRAILPLDLTAFLLFLCLLLFQFISFDFSPPFLLLLFFFFISFFLHACIWVFLLRSDPILSIPLFTRSFQGREDKFLVKSSDTRTTIYGLLRKGFPWEVKPWYAAKGLRVNFGWF